MGVIHSFICCLQHTAVHGVVVVVCASVITDHACLPHVSEHWYLHV